MRNTLGTKGGKVEVLKAYFTPTRIEAEMAVFVTEDRNVADYAVYPVQAVDADVRVYRVDSPFLADHTVVMAGDSQNAYVEYRGGYYNAGGRTHADHERSSTTVAHSAPTYQPPRDADIASPGTLRFGCAGVLFGIGVSMIAGYILLPIGVIGLLVSPSFGLTVLMLAAVLWFFGQWVSGDM